MRLNIANIQHFAVGDGDGIRTTVFFKGCCLHCPWCHNPETIPAEVSVMRYPKLDRTERCGRRMTPREVLEDILIDRDFCVESGGGVTFSGGEVLLQAEGAAELAAMLRQAETGTLFVDTAGCVEYAAVERLNPYTDAYLFDYKTASEEKYRTVIGGSLRRVEENIRRLMEDGKTVRIRIPLIPGFNTADGEVDAICSALARLNVTEAELLPFHRLGSGKYEALGIEYAYANTPPLSGAELERIRERYERHMTVRIEK